MLLDPQHKEIAELVQDLRGNSAIDASRSGAEILRRFEPLFRKYWARIRTRAAPMGMEYEDFVQEIALRIVKHLDKVKNLHAFPGYIQSITFTTATDVLRVASRTVTGEPLEALRDQVLDGILDDTLETLVVRSYLDQLDPRQALCLDLSLVRELDTAACAKQLKISESGFRTLKSRALRQLEEVIGREAGAITKS
jgi:RNA polymerase sigma factor (sigma-70 family)